MRGGGGGGRWSAPGVDDEEQLSAEEAKHVIRRALRMLRPYRAQAILGAVVIVGYVLATLSGPLWVRYGIDAGLGGSEGVEAADRSALTTAVIAYLVTAGLAVILFRTMIIVIAKVGESFLRDLRVRVFHHMIGMPQSFYDKQQTGKLVARMTSDIDSLQELVQQGLVMFVSNGLLMTLAILLLVSMSPLLSLLCLLPLPMVILASKWFRRESNRAYLTVRDRISQTLSTLQEGISGIRVIQAFGQEETQVGRFRHHNDAQLAANLEATRISAKFFPVIELAGLGTTAAVVGIGGWLVLEGRVSVGTIGAFILLLSYLFEPVQQLSQLFDVLQRAGAALNKLFGLLDTPPDLTERPGAVDLPVNGSVEVDDLSFSYDGRTTVLQGVDLTISHGERIAFVGPTGAGKSTLAKIVARLYDPTEGAVRYGGVDLRDATFASLRERICVVPQEGFLFYGTILDNVRIGRPDATDDEAVDAMKRIGVYEHFANLPDGLHTEVRERGSRLSAGERQLVSLSRAALADPGLLVLDEATSNLDPGTEHEVEAALNALMEGRTVIVIAHRLSTAERADRVAVVDAGGLAEIGTHEELVAKGGRYAALFRSWEGGLAPTAGG